MSKASLSAASSPDHPHCARIRDSIERLGMARVSLLVAGSLVVLATCVLLASCSPGPAVDYEGRRELQFAERLVEEKRFREADALLEDEVRRRSDDQTAYQALLYMAELREAEGDQDGAAEARKLAMEMRGRLNRENARTQAGNGASSIAPGGSSRIEGLENNEADDPIINNSFFDTGLRQVLSDLSFDAGVPILWDSTVQGLVTYEAVDQPLSSVLRSILVPLGFTYARVDGGYWVGSADPDGPAFGPLSRTVVRPLANMESEIAVRLLGECFRPYVRATNVGNLVCITAPPTFLERILADLDAIDAPRELVMIEVIMAEITKTGMEQVGVNWFASGPSDDGGRWEINTAYSGSEVAGVVGSLDRIGMAAIDWTARLEALVLDGRAEIRASPRVTTLNGRPATISLTRDQYFIIQTGGGVGYQYNTLESVTSGIKLKITPMVSADGNVTVYVKPEVGDVTGESPTSELPEISWRRAETAIRVQDGETFSIGGLNLEQEQTIRKKVPILGEIPLLGRLFSHESREKKQSEVVVFLTPHVVKNVRN